MTLHYLRMPGQALRASCTVLLMLGCTSALAASFDCRKARSTSERLVCADPALSAMDDRLGALAAAGKKRAASPRAFQRQLDQAWLARQACQDRACVEQWYERRLQALASQAPATGSVTEPARTAAAARPKQLDPQSPRAATVRKTAPNVPKTISDAAPSKAPVTVPAVSPKTAAASVTAPPAGPAAVLAKAPDKVAATVTAPSRVPAPVPPPPTPAAPIAAAPSKAPQAVLAGPARTAVAPIPAAPRVSAAVQAQAPKIAARPAARPVVPRSPSAASVEENVGPGGQFQVIGSLLGFDIPLSKKDFIDRFEASGGQCGASKQLAGLKALSPSAASDCWSGTQCPAPTDGVACKMIRTAYDRAGRMVLFTATLHSESSNPLEGKREMTTVLRKFSELGLSEPKITDLKNGQVTSATGTQGQFTLGVEILSLAGEQQVGIFSIALK